MSSMERSIYIVSTCEKSAYSVAIYRIMIDDTYTIVSSSNIDPVVLALPTPTRVSLSVGCAMVGSDLCLLASYKSMKEKHYCKFIQLPPVIYRTHTGQVMELPKPKACKPYPAVMAVKGRGFALANSRAMEIDIHGLEYPSFECFNPRRWEWGLSSPLPELPFPGKSTLHVGGYAVVNDTIVLSAVGVYSNMTTKFYCYKVERVSKEWRVVSKEDEAAEYPSFEGKAEYVDGAVYAFIRHCELIAYTVKFTTDGAVQSLGPPLRFGKLDFAEPPCEWHPLMTSSCFACVGDRVFCFIRTGFSGNRNLQYACVLTAAVFAGMDLVTLSSVVRSISVLNPGEGCYFSDCFCPKISEDYWEKALQRQNSVIDDSESAGASASAEALVPKTKSVVSSYSRKRVQKGLLLDVFLQRLGLEKYTSKFEEEEINFEVLQLMNDGDLKDIGLPKGPRTKILVALKSGVYI